MKIIFIGTSNFGVPSLEMLKKDHTLLLVITQPDRPVGRKKTLTSPPVKAWGKAYGIRVLQPEKISETSEEIKRLAPDVLVVAAYGQIIPKGILDLPIKGSINLHGSILPKYRGASPIQSAIMNDEKETGVSVILMDEKMDHGPVLVDGKIAIDEKDDYTSLHEKLSQVAASLLKATLTQLELGKLNPQPQNEEQATFTKLLKREDAKLDWTKPARQIVQKIKALNPEPGTWTTLNEKSVKILKAEEIRNGVIDVPGNIYSQEHECLVKCGDYSIKLITVQQEGRKPISGEDFLHGLKNLETKLFV